MRKIGILMVLIAVSFLTATAQEEWQSTATNDWNTPMSWFSPPPGTVGNGNPAATDNATITGGHTVTVTADATINDLTVDGILVINAGVTLTVNGTLIINDVGQVGDGELIVNGNAENNGTFTGEIGGNVHITGDYTNNGMSEFYENTLVVDGATSGNAINWLNAPPVPIAPWSIGLAAFLIIGFVAVRRFRQ